MSDTAIDPSGSGRPRSHWFLTAAGGLVALALIIWFLVWTATRDDDVVTGPTATGPAATTVAPSTSAAPTTAAATTSIATTTTAATTTSPTTTTNATTTTTTLADTTTTSLPAPSGDSWTVTSPYLADQPMEMVRTAELDGIAAYDGQVTVGSTDFRCVAITVDGEPGWQEWCAEAGAASTFVAFDGIAPVLVELGAATGTVTLTPQEPSWTVPTNGCAAPISTLAAAADMSPATISGIVCVPGEAFVTFAGVWLQAGPPDGGGVLLVEGDEGWNSTGFGTSIGCDDLPDGVDRCDEFGVEYELFEAALPLPAAGLWAIDIIGVGDQTAAVRAWVGAETDPAVVADLVLAEVGDPDAAEEAPPTVGRFELGGWTLLLVEVRHLDDSIASTTWAVWVDPARDPAVIRATAWATCFRGVVGDLCV